MRSRFSVIVPSFNQGAYLGEALASIALQRADAETLVLDGGSGDCTRAVIESWAHLITWWRSEPDRGQAAAVNEGVGRSSGDLICWLNSDDLLCRDTLREVATLFESDSSVDAVVGAGFWADDRLQRYSYWAAPRSLRLEDYGKAMSILAQPSIFWRRATWERLGGLREDLHYALDYDLVIRLLKSKARIRFLERGCSINRIHSAAKGQGDRIGPEIFRIAQEHFGPIVRARPKSYVDAFGWSLLRIFGLRYLLQTLLWRFVGPADIRLPGGIVPLRQKKYLWRKTELDEAIKVR